MSTTSTSEQKEFGPTVKLIVSLVLMAAIGGGVYLTQRGLKSIEESLDAKGWPTTEGVITHSFVHTKETPVKKNGRVVPNQKTKSYSPDIAYTYSVKGQELTGTRVTVDSESLGTKASAQAIVDRYPPQKSVKVSYHPTEPSRAVLEPGSLAGSYRWFLPGGLLILVPLLVLRGIWSRDPQPKLSEVRNDPNHPERAHLLGELLMVESVERWEPGQLVHLRRARVGLMQTILGGIVTGFILGVVFGLLPAVFFLSKHGVIFIGKVYLAVSAALALVSVIALMLWGRRREYLFDWSLGTIHTEIGWSSRDYSLDQMELLILDLPASDGERNAIVDSYSIRFVVAGKKYTLIETNGKDLSWGQVRDRLVALIRPLAHHLNVEWQESRDRSKRATGSSL